MKSSKSPEGAILCLRDSIRQLKKINKKRIKTIFLVLIALCLVGTGFGQKENVEPFYIGDRVPDLPLHRLINYKDSSATLSSFGHKLLILDFWSVHCTTCIHMFPLEDSLQGLFKDSVQFLLVTMDSIQKVQKFLHKWDSIHFKALSIPIVTTDRLLCRLFRFKFIPHYVWLMPNGTMLAQTSEDFIHAAAIRQILKAIREKEQELKADGFGKEMFHFPRLSAKQQLLYAPLLKPNVQL